jgi:hypothetical protein
MKAFQKTLKKCKNPQIILKKILKNSQKILKKYAKICPNTQKK